MHLCIEMEAIDTVPVVEIISRVVLATCRDLKLEIAGLAAIRLLEPSDVGGCVLAGHRRILARGFLPAAPPRVPEYVHVGAPVCEAGLPPIVHCPCLVGHDLRMLEHQ